jgi:hypothetical protein
MDYFLLLAGEGIHEIDSASIVNELRKFNEIQAAFIIDVESLKSKNNLIF